MLVSAETLILGLVSSLVLLLTAGLIPFQIKRMDNRNTKQHQKAVDQRDVAAVERAEQMAVLEKISKTQDTMKADVLIIKGKVYTLESLRIADKEEFLKLYEKVLINEHKEGLILPHVEP